jgi:4-hydroxy-2-oxoheptanedioate aldolase
MIGIFSKTTDSSFIESATLTGLDFIIIDQEHGPVSRERLFDHIRAVSNDSLAIVRVAELNHNLIGAAYDAGAHGVQVPNISSVEEAKSAIEAARFYPKGMRGVCRFVKAASYGSMDKVDYFKNENDKLLILQVEGTKGIENIDAILSLDGFDILFIGPYDLSQSLGIPGQIQHHLVQENIIKIVQKAKAKNIKVGTFVDTFEGLTTMKKLGIDYIAFSVDVNIFYNACKTIINQYVEN